MQSLDTRDENVDPNTPLSEEEIIDLGYHASQLIIAASAITSTGNLTDSLFTLTPLNALTILCQNFPKYAQLLSRRVPILPAVDAELQQNALKAQAGGTLNGVDVLKMKRVLRREKEWIRALEALGLSRQEAVKVVSDSGGGAGEEGKAKTSQVSKEIMDGRVDASDRQEGGDVILWWNDIEKDARYARWGTSFYAETTRKAISRPTAKFDVCTI